MESSGNLSLRGTVESSRGEREEVAPGNGSQVPHLAAERPTRFIGDRIFQLTTLVPAVLVLALLAGFALVLTVESHPSLAKFGLSFFSGTDWDPVNEQFGALPFVYGTVMSSAIALLLAIPLSLGVALCMVEMAPTWLANQIGFLVELLAAIPSVGYGLWGIFVLGPWLRDWVDPVLARFLGFLPFFQGPKLSVSLLSAGVILAVMIIPYIT